MLHPADKKMPFFCLQPGDMVAIGANQYIGLVIGSDFTIIFITILITVGTGTPITFGVITAHLITIISGDHIRMVAI